MNTFGVLYVALLAKYDQGAGTTAWVGSMANAMGLLLGIQIFLKYVTIDHSFINLMI